MSKVKGEFLFTFPSGITYQPTKGVIGIDHTLTVYGGYDDILTGEYGFVEEYYVIPVEGYKRSNLSLKDKMWLCHVMLKRWKDLLLSLEEQEDDESEV